MNHKYFKAMLLALPVLLTAWPSQSPASAPFQPERFTAVLEGSQEVPPVATGGSGKCSVTLSNFAVSVDCSFQGLTANAVASHIHLAPVGTNGPVILPLTPTAAKAGSITGNGVLTAQQAAELRAGNTYVNLHTSAFPPGEIRGQIVPVATPVPSSSHWSRMLGALMLLALGAAALREKLL
jgi:hypothetical protein